MLPRSRRVPLTQFFAQRGGGKIVVGHLALLAKRRLGKPGRFGVIVKKEHVKKAVDRHLLKRRISSLYPLEQFPGVDICFIAGKGADTLSFAALKKEVYALFAELRKKI